MYFGGKANSPPIFEKKGNWRLNSKKRRVLLGLPPKYISDGLIHYKQKNLTKKENKNFGSVAHCIHFPLLPSILDTHPPFDSHHHATTEEEEDSYHCWPPSQGLHQLGEQQSFLSRIGRANDSLARPGKHQSQIVRQATASS